MTLRTDTLEQPGRVKAAQYVPGGDHEVRVAANFNGGTVTLMHRSTGPDGRSSAYQALHTFRESETVLLNLPPGDIFFDVVEADRGPPEGVSVSVQSIPRPLKGAA